MYFPAITVSSNSLLGAREQVSEEALRVLSLGHGLTQAVHKDGGTAVGLQDGAEEPLQEHKELLVLRRQAHLERETQQTSSRVVRCYLIELLYLRTPPRCLPKVD